jgi:hypothetical protein
MNDFSLDRLHSVDARKAGQAAMACFDRLQLTYTPEQQAAGVGVILLLLQSRYGFCLNDALKVANNLINRAGQDTPEIRAAKTYVDNEL